MSDKLDLKAPLGVILDLPGAPETPHTVIGVRGQYRPNVATPIGGDGEITLDEAQAAIDKGAPLRLVNVAKKDVEALREQAAEDLADARRGAVQARKEDLIGAEPSVLNDQLEAVKE